MVKYATNCLCYLRTHQTRDRKQGMGHVRDGLALNLLCDRGSGAPRN